MKWQQLQTGIYQQELYGLFYKKVREDIGLVLDTLQPKDMSESRNKIEGKGDAVCDIYSCVTEDSKRE